jgi:hypothetical protein
VLAASRAGAVAVRIALAAFRSEEHRAEPDRQREPPRPFAREEPHQPVESIAVHGNASNARE